MVAIMVLRHAERNGIRNLSDVVHAKLTDRGKDDARQLGARLAKFFGFKEIEVMASLLDRCQETAKEVAAGYGKMPDTSELKKQGT